MSGLTLVAEELFSKAARSKIGVRVIEGFEVAESKNTGGVGGIVAYIFSGLGSLANFLVSKITDFFQFSWTTFWSWCVAAEQFIWNFNWNSTDAELEQNIKGQYAALTGQLGTTLGQTFGYITCGIVPGAIIFAFNEPLGTQILIKVTEKFVENFLQNLGILLQQTLILGTQILLTETFKTVRKILKSTSPLIQEFLGKSNGVSNALDAWGGEKSKPWSFAKAYQDTQDSIFGKEGAGAQFANQFSQQATQSCIEAGYVVANTADTFLAHQALANQKLGVLGNERYVEITPNKKVPDEKIVLAGSEELLKPLIVQTLATNQQFNGRDLGVVYGQLNGESAERRYRPDVVLQFRRKANKLKSKGEVVTALSMRISFRLMNKSIADFATDFYLKQLAELIYVEFAETPFMIHKGTHVYTYADFQKGYQLKLDVNGEVEALRVIKSVLSIQEHPFHEAYFRKGSTPVEPLPATGQTIEIRGQEVVLPINNKSGIVKFTHAYLDTGVNVPPINLVDLTGKKKNVVYKPVK